MAVDAVVLAVDASGFYCPSCGTVCCLVLLAIVAVVVWYFVKERF